MEERTNKLVVALIAHNSRKEDMVCLVKAHQIELAAIDLIATRGTGQLIQARTGLNVILLQTSSHGGAVQIGALVANEEVNAVLFLRDPLSIDEDYDLHTLQRVCDVHEIPFATNVISAEAVLHLIFEHPEALSRHHLTPQYLEDVASSHD